MRLYQQGDVLLKTTNKPSKVEIVKTNLLWKGQNHHHRLKGRYRIGKSENDLYVHSKGSILYHEEHKDIFLPEGFYKVDIVQEYDHWEEEARKVID